MQLKSVVFPAPFGPMRPTISPAFTSNETPAFAASPPKNLLTFRISKRAFAPLAGRRWRAAPDEGHDSAVIAPHPAFGHPLPADAGRGTLQVLRAERGSRSRRESRRSAR